MAYSFKNLILLSLILLLSVVRAVAGDTIVVNRPFYHIDHKKNIIIINQRVGSINGAGALKEHLMLDDKYSFVDPVSVVNTAASYQAECKDSLYTVFFTHLPSIHINTKSQIVDAPSIYAEFSLSEASGTIVQSAIGIEIRGGSSQGRPKKSYELSFWNDTVGNASRDVRLLSMRNDNKWNLQAMYNESARLQSKISNELWQDIHQVYYKNLEPDAKNGVNMEYVEVFINSEYKGVYALSERIDRKQLKLKKYDNQQIKGELYKGSDWGGATTFTSLPPFDNTRDTWGGFEYKHPEEQIDWTNLYNFADFVENSSDQDFYSRYKSLFKLDNAVDYYIFLNLLRATDNTGKNLYIAKYKTGEPYYYVPWDLDGVFGFNWQGLQDNTTNDILSNGFYDRLIQDCSPNGFRAVLNQRWRSLRTATINENNIMAKINSSNSYLIENNVYEREQMAWGDYQYDSAQLAYIRSWLRDRLNYLDVVFNQSCITLAASPVVKNEVEFKMYPNPAKGYLIVESGSSRCDISIQDITGKIVLKYDLVVGSSKLDVSMLPKGLYIAMVKNDKLSKTAKLIIE